MNLNEHELKGKNSKTIIHKKYCANLNLVS
jgi:hypothetical protein